MLLTEEARGGEALLLFARYPFAGDVKTRLAAGIGAGNARRLYSCFLKDMAAQLRLVDAEVFVFYAPASAGPEVREYFPGFECLPQEGAALGDRMRNAFRAVFDKGITRAVVIGSDLPGLEAGRIREAFEHLEQGPAVIGPALDGGYYLLGLREESFAGRLFENISWGSPAVLAQTLQRFRELDVAPAVLGSLSDIDDLEDLRRFYRERAARESAPATVGFIDWALTGLVPYENIQE